MIASAANIWESGRCRSSGQRGPTDPSKSHNQHRTLKEGGGFNWGWMGGNYPFPIHPPPPQQPKAHEPACGNHFFFFEKSIRRSSHTLKIPVRFRKTHTYTLPNPPPSFPQREEKVIHFETPIFLSTSSRKGDRKLVLPFHPQYPFCSPGGVSFLRGFYLKERDQGLQMTKGKRTVWFFQKKTQHCKLSEDTFYPG